MKSRAIEHVDKIINVDQDPLGNSPSSNPATYTGALRPDPRALQQDARIESPRFIPLGGSASTRRGGRCEACEGNGQKEDRDALPPRCVGGMRYLATGSATNPETLLVKNVPRP